MDREPLPQLGRQALIEPALQQSLIEQLSARVTELDACSKRPRNRRSRRIYVNRHKLRGLAAE
jgi:hypothetical protein